MKLRMKILIVMGSLMLLVFAVNLGVAYAHPDVSDDGLANAPVNPNSALLTAPALANAAIDLVQLNTDKVPVCGAHVD